MIESTLKASSICEDFSCFSVDYLTVWWIGGGRGGGTVVKLEGEEGWYIIEGAKRAIDLALCVHNSSLKQTPKQKFHMNRDFMAHEEVEGEGEGVIWLILPKEEKRKNTWGIFFQFFLPSIFPLRKISNFLFFCFTLASIAYLMGFDLSLPNYLTSFFHPTPHSPPPSSLALASSEHQSWLRFDVVFSSFFRVLNFLLQPISDVTRFFGLENCFL